MLGQIGNAHRFKCSVTDVQSDFGDRNARVFIFSKISGVKCSPAVGAAIAPFSGENGLITLAVFVQISFFAFDIRRQRRFARFLLKSRQSRRQLQI